MKTAKLWTRNFRLVILASAMGTIGAIAGSFALAFLVFDETGSTFGIRPDRRHPAFAVSAAPGADRAAHGSASPQSLFGRGRSRKRRTAGGMGLWLLAFDFSYVGYLALSLLLACLGAVDELAFTSIYPELIPEGAEEKRATRCPPCSTRF